MIRAPGRATAALLGVLCAGPAAAGAEPPSLRIETRVSPTTALVHWVDNLAGTSAGKTASQYRRYWRERFGQHDAGDVRALERFASLRRKARGAERRVLNRTGCLPVAERDLSWHQRFLAEAMRAASIADLARRLQPDLDDGERAALVGVLEHFRPRFETIDRSHVERFDRRFQAVLADGGLIDLLGQVAAFLGVDPAGLPPMRVSFVALPGTGATHAEAAGDDLLIEVRPGDRPFLQIPVVAHEAAHFLMRRMGAERVDALARAIYSAGDAAPLIWKHLWEGLPTALGQGLAEARLSPATFSPRNRWYHVDVVDRFAKRVYPVVRDGVLRAEPLDGGPARRIAGALAGWRRFREAPLAEHLTAAVFVGTAEAAAPLEELRRQIGSSRDGASLQFPLGQARGREWMERFSCLSGLVLAPLSAREEIRAFGRSSGIAPERIEAVLQVAEGARGVVAAERRPSGGLVVLLVARGPDRLDDVLQLFRRLQGVPPVPVPVRAGGAVP